MLIRTLKFIESSINTALPDPPQNHAPKHHIHTFLKYLQGQWFPALKYLMCRKVSYKIEIDILFENKLKIVKKEKEKKPIPEIRRMNLL